MIIEYTSSVSHAQTVGVIFFLPSSVVDFATHVREHLEGDFVLVLTEKHLKLRHTDAPVTLYAGKGAKARQGGRGLAHQ